MKHWIQAARLRTLPLSVSGIIVGSCIAASKGQFNIYIFLLAILTTIGFQVLSNFANDYGDGVKGTDNENRVGPQRALQSGVITPKQMLKAMYITGVITFIVALLLIYISFGKENFLYSLLFIVLGLASIAAAIKYTVGKNAYGYAGLGDVFVFAFFGLLSVLGSEFLYTKQFDVLSILPAITIGLLSTAVLHLNNMRDRASDILAHKNTLSVKLGVKKSKIYHYLILVIGTLTALLYSMMRYSTLIQFMYIISFIPIIKNIIVVYQNKEAVLLDPELKKVALSAFLFSILFGIGLVLS